MESTNPILSQGVDVTEYNWKGQVPFANRQKVVTRIGEWLIKNRFLHPQEALRAQYIASKFEDKIFSIATSQDDYRRMISIKLKQQEKAQWQQSLTSSAPGPSYIVESSLHQASSSLPQYHGHLRPSDIQPAFQKQPSSVVVHPLPHQQNPTAVNSRLNVEQKATPNLLSQHMLYGFDSHSGTNMHHLGQKFSASTCNIQFSNSGMQRLGLQTGSQLSNMSQTRMLPQENNIQEMEEGVSKTNNSVVDDWKEELYNKITKLKDSFLTPLIIQQEKVAKLVQKMDSVSHQSSSEYVKLQKLHTKVICFLNFSKDRMSEEVRNYFPECEKLVFHLLQVKSQGQISSPQGPQQKNFTTSDAQSPKMPVLLQSQDKEQTVTAQMEDNHNQQLQITENLVFNKNWMQGVETKRGKFVHNKHSGNSSLSNTKLRKPQPVPSPCKSSTVQILVKEKQREDANLGDTHCQATFGGQDVEGNENLRQISATDLFEPRVSEEPIQRLIKAVKSMSPNTFRVSVSDIKSVLRMVDSCNGLKFVVGEDLATATPIYCGKKRDSSSQATQGNKYAIAIPYKRPRIEVNVQVNGNLLDEITEINLKLIETVVEISQNDVIIATKESFTDSRDEGTVVRCCYTPVGTSPHLKSELASFVRSPIMPLKLLVPTSYPTNSPVLMDKLPSETSMNCEDLSAKAKLKLILNLQSLRQPMSLTDIARTWDTCARAVVFECARKLGGGDFSSTVGPWSAPLLI